MDNLFLEIRCFVLYIMGIVEMEEIEEAVLGDRCSH
jgi:hypothetical protein